MLSRGVKSIPLKLGGQVRNVVSIELDYLPLWLAKIAITPRMKKDKPEVVEKLIDYQIKAKDVLANAFIHGVATVPKTYKESIEALLKSLEKNEELEKENLIMRPKVDEYKQIAEAKNVTEMIIEAKNIGVGEYKLFAFLRANDVLLMKDGINFPKQRFLNEGMFRVITKVGTEKHGRSFVSHSTRVTGKGKLFILKLVNKYGGAKAVNSIPLKEMKHYVNNYVFRPIESRANL